MGLLRRQKRQAADRLDYDFDVPYYAYPDKHTSGFTKPDTTQLYATLSPAGSATASSLHILYTISAELDALFICDPIHCPHGQDGRRSIMDTLHTGLLIRALIVLVTMAVLVVAGLVLAHRERRRASNPHGVHPTNVASGQAAIAQGCHGTRLVAGDWDRTAPKFPRVHFKDAWRSLIETRTTA